GGGAGGGGAAPGSSGAATSAPASGTSYGGTDGAGGSGPTGYGQGSGNFAPQPTLRTASATSAPSSALFAQPTAPGTGGKITPLSTGPSTGSGGGGPLIPSTVTVNVVDQ